MLADFNSPDEQPMLAGTDNTKTTTPRHLVLVACAGVVVIILVSLSLTRRPPPTEVQQSQAPEVAEVAEALLGEPFLTDDERTAAAKQFAATTDEVLNYERQFDHGTKYERMNALYFSLYQEEIRRANAKLPQAPPRRRDETSGTITSPDDYKSMAITNDDKATPITMAQEFVKGQLKSPSSASFPWSFNEYAVTRRSDGRWSVSGYVEATNSFNATIKARWSVEMQRVGTKWELLSINVRE